MMFRISSWRPVHLLLAWCAYWLTLVLVTIGPAVPALSRISAEDAHGSASMSFGDGAVRMVVSEGVQSVWSRDIGFGTIVAAVGIPPLLLWALWLRAQRRRSAPTPVDRSAERV